MKKPDPQRLSYLKEKFSPKTLQSTTLEDYVETQIEIFSLTSDERNLYKSFIKSFNFKLKQLDKAQPGLAELILVRAKNDFLGKRELQLEERIKKLQGEISDISLKRIRLSQRDKILSFKVFKETK